MAQKKRIGEVLKEAGLIDDFQLEAALSHQRNWGGKLGVILVEMGFARDEDIARVIAERLHIPVVELFDPPIPPAVLKVLKPDIAKKYTVIPARKEGEAVLIAMADPLDIKTLDELRFITGLSVKPALASEADIKDAIRKYYDHEDVVRRVKAPVAFQPGIESGPMDIIRESGRAAVVEPAEPAQPRQEPPALPKEEPLRQELSGVKLHVEALITLLLEKGLITRDELVRIIEHKKIGL
jgi:type IV pilus assembly protein PilB